MNVMRKNADWKARRLAQGKKPLFVDDGFNPEQPRDEHGRWTDGVDSPRIRKMIAEKVEVRPQMFPGYGAGRTMNEALPMFDQVLSPNTSWTFLRTPKGLATVSFNTLHDLGKNPRAELHWLLAVDRGAGRSAMEMINKAADQNNIVLEADAVPLPPDTGGKKMSVNELVNWYKGFGFKTVGRPDKEGYSRIRRMPQKITKDAADRGDMTGTEPLQKLFKKDFKRRWQDVRNSVREGLKTYDFTGVGDRIVPFQNWLDSLMAQHVLGSGMWMSAHLKRSADMGIARAQGLVQGPSITNDADVDWMRLMQDATVSELRGIMEAVAQQATRMLGKGIISRKNPTNDILSVITNVGEARSNMLVNHSIIKMFSIATLETFRAQGVEQVGTIPETVPHVHIGDAARKTVQKRGKDGKFAKYTKPISRANRRKAEQQHVMLKELGTVNVLTAEDDRVCDTCERISDDGPYGIDHAMSLIPAHVNCILPGAHIDADVLAGLKSFYSGPAVEIVTVSGKRLSLTINHPVLTEKAAIFAGQLRKGMKLITDGAYVGRVPLSVQNNKHNDEALVEKVFGTLSLSGTMFLSPSAQDFHGDARSVKGNIDVVVSDSRLLPHIDTLFSKGISDGFLTSSDMSDISLTRFGTSNNFFVRPNPPARSIPRGGALLFDSLPVLLEGLPLHSLRVGLGTRFDVVRPENAVYDPAIYTKFAREIIDGHSLVVEDDDLIRRHDVSLKSETNFNTVLPEAPKYGVDGYTSLTSKTVDRSSSFVELDEVFEVRHFHYVGHVYDLQTTTGWFIANGIGIFNCRCVFIPVGRLPMTDMNPNHVPAGSPEGGQFASLSQLQSGKEALARGVWKFEQNHFSDRWNEKITGYSITSNDIPTTFKSFERKPGDVSYYDPSYVQVEEGDYPMLKMIDPANHDTGPKVSEPNTVYRGMSFEEYQQALKTGEIRSLGDYNLGTEQEGLTFYSTEVDQATSYASGYAPWQFKPTPSRPAVVVAVKDPGHRDYTYHTEVGFKKPLKTADITKVYMGHVVAMSPGIIETVETDGKVREGSRSSPTPWVVWKEEKPITMKDYNPNHAPAGDEHGGEFTFKGTMGKSEPAFGFSGMSKKEVLQTLEVINHKLSADEDITDFLQKQVETPTISMPGVAQLLLDNGKYYEADENTFAGPRGEPKMCYMNAGRACMDDPEKTYVEGYVEVEGVPIAHAWYLDKNGKVVDPTIRSAKPTNYFGIPFRTNYLLLSIMKNKYWGLLGEMSKKTIKPLITGKEKNFLKDSELDMIQNAVSDEDMQRIAEALKHYALDSGFDPSQERDDHGRWTRQGQISLGAKADWIRQKIDKVADDMGFPRERIFMTPNQHKFMLNGEIHASGGFAVNDPDGFNLHGEHYQHGDIVIIDHKDTKFAEDFPVTGVVAHEIEHQRYLAVKEAYLAETRKVLYWQMEPNAGFTPKPEFASEYPTLTALREFNTVASITKLAEEDGVTNYSAQYWVQHGNNPGAGMLDLAMNETLAEIARLKYEETAKYITETSYDDMTNWIKQFSSSLNMPDAAQPWDDLERRFHMRIDTFANDMFRMKFGVRLSDVTPDHATKTVTVKKQWGDPLITPLWGRFFDAINNQYLRMHPKQSP